MELVLVIGGILLAAAFLGGWYVTSPRNGAGWLLFAAIVVALGGPDRLEGTASVLMAIGLAILFLAVWVYDRTRPTAKQYAGWVLFGAVISVLAIF